MPTTIYYGVRLEGEVVAVYDTAGAAQEAAPTYGANPEDAGELTHPELLELGLVEPPGDAIYVYTFADEEAREAGTGYDLQTEDIGKVARQLDDETFWVLTDASPITWVALGGGGGFSGGTVAGATTFEAAVNFDGAVDMDAGLSVNQVVIGTGGIIGGEPTGDLVPFPNGFSCEGPATCYADTRLASGEPATIFALHGATGTGQHAAIADVTDEASVVAAFNQMLAYWRTRGDVAT